MALTVFAFAALVSKSPSFPGFLRSSCGDSAGASGAAALAVIAGWLVIGSPPGGASGAPAGAVSACIGAGVAPLSPGSLLLGEFLVLSAALS